MTRWRVEAARSGALGFDANTKISATAAKALKSDGFDFGVRYLTRGTEPAAHDLDREEAETLRAAGLALMAAQHVAPAGWMPTTELGRTYGDNAVCHARAIGLPGGVTIWLDLEGVHGSADSGTVIEYCNAWHRRVEDGGYHPGIYVGVDCRLSGEQAFGQLHMTAYWRSGTAGTEGPTRGYCMAQSIIPGDRVGGVEIDRNIVMEDNLGTTPYWATAPA